MVRTLTLDHLIERNAYLYPQHPALLIYGRAITHAQMAERVRRIGSALARGLPRQSRVAVLSQNSAEYIEIMNGVHISGLILVTLNWRLATLELRSIVLDGFNCCVSKARINVFGCSRPRRASHSGNRYRARLSSVSGR